MKSFYAKPEKSFSESALATLKGNAQMEISDIHFGEQFVETKKVAEIDGHKVRINQYDQKKTGTPMIGFELVPETTVKKGG